MTDKAILLKRKYQWPLPMGFPSTVCNYPSIGPLFLYWNRRVQHTHRTIGKLLK